MRKSIAQAVVLDSVQIIKPVPIVPKDLPSLITMDNNMVKRSFEFHPRLPGQRANRAKREPLNQYSGLTLTPQRAPQKELTS
jgi:hypothetical protein